MGDASVEADETADAGKVKYGPADALRLLDGVTKLVAVKGESVVVHDLTVARPADAELTALMIGPTGNLRAPTARVGSTLVVGFSEGAYGDVLGG